MYNYFPLGFARSCLVVAAVSLLCSHSAAEDKASDVLSSDRFPMDVGYKWIYEFGDKEVSFEVLSSEKIKRGHIFVVRRKIGDAAAVDFKLSVKDHGVYIHEEGKKRFSPPLRQFAFFARKGDIWKWSGTVDQKTEREEFTNLGVQKITVPAGTYSTIAVEQRNPKNLDGATFWLADGIGVVKLAGKTESKPDDQGRVLVFVWQLKRFTKPNK